jgi:hypothetical protein
LVGFKFGGGVRKRSARASAALRAHFISITNTRAQTRA